MVLILRQPQQLGDILESLGWGIPVQTSSGLTERTQQMESVLPHQMIKKLSCTLRAGGNSRRKNAQQLLPVGDVRHHGLCAVEEEQEDVAGVSPVTVNLLCCLLGQAAHHALHSARRIGQSVYKLLQTAVRQRFRGNHTHL